MNRTRVGVRQMKTGIAVSCVLSVCVACGPAWGAPTPGAGGKPTSLTCESLTQPMGLETEAPLLSWKLQDGRQGAKQSAYQIFVSSRQGTGRAGEKADVWDSGRVASDQSVNVRYAGPALQPEKRYFWRVKVWDKDGTEYPVSDTSWWEMGLLRPEEWRAKWIGYEERELHAIRESGAQWITNAEVRDYTMPGDTHHGYRMAVDLKDRVKSATLYSTGEDTTAVWVNGQEVRQTEPLPPWKQTPWGTYVRQDVTKEMRDGRNELAVEVTHFDIGGGRRGAIETKTPMSLCLYLVMADGSDRVLTSSPDGWKAMLNPQGEWTKAGFDDSGWKSAEKYEASAGQTGANAAGLPWPTGPVAALRRSFEEKSAVVSARLYATALGAYKFHINGTVVGDQILAPGWMDFREHVPYQVYDVTSSIHAGKNAIAAYLAPGWYSTPLMWYRQGNNYGATQPALKAQLRLEHADGSVEWIATDETWKASMSPILFAEIYDGETYDARREQRGWDTASFAETDWKPAMLVQPKEPRILPQYFQPIREEKVLTAKTVTSPKPGVYVFDFGQNLSGVPQLRVSGQAGDDVRLRFAEVLNADGTVYLENLRTAKATDHYILSGGKTEEYKPQFTFHGFRYIEVTGVRSRPALDAVKTVVFHTDAPFTMNFKSGDPMVNQLWSNILWGQRSNFIGLPTDCPQRDERLGWSADAQVFWRTAAYNMDLTTFSQKYAADLRGTQVNTPMYGFFAPGTSSPNPGFGPGWSDAGVIVPWTGWIQTGNRRIVDENWDGMVSYLANIKKQNPDFLWRNGIGVPFGDWLTPTQTTPEDLVATAYWAYDVSRMQQMAAATGREADAAAYGELFSRIKEAFVKAYVKPDGFVGAFDKYPSIPPPTATPLPEGTDRSTTMVETQTGYVLALYMDLLPTELRKPAAEKLVAKIKENHWLLGTGFLGTPYLLEVLSDTGHNDVAYRLLLNKEYPSWGYLIEHGATTTWERWNGDQMRGDPSMNSYNHYAYGAVGEWMYRYVAGVDTVSTDSGFHTIYLHPNFDARLGTVDMEYQTPYGAVKSAWRTTGLTVTWHLTVPPNAKGTLPMESAKANGFTLDGQPLESNKVLRLQGDRYEIPAGEYVFTGRLQSAGVAKTGAAGME